MWSNGGTTPDPNSLAIGTYTVTVTDANGCETTCDAEISCVGMLNANVDQYQTLESSDVQEFDALKSNFSFRKSLSNKWFDQSPTRWEIGVNAQHASYE